MKLMLRNSTGETVSVSVQPEETFESLKRRVRQEVGVLLDLQDLTVKGQPVTDDMKVVEYFSKPDSKKMFDGGKTEVGRCAVPTCHNTKSACPDKAFFPFPQEEMRCHQWVLYCHRMAEASARTEPRMSLSPSQSVMCADHFRKDQFVKNTTTLLKRYAVPCVTSNLAGVVGGEKLILCRLCSELCNDSILIFDDTGIKLGIADKINSCLPVIVRETDPLPKQVCRSCYEKLLFCHNFSKVTIKAEKTLWDSVEEKTSSSQPIYETHAGKSFQKISLQPNTKVQLSNISTLDYAKEESQSYSCPLCSCGKMLTKSGVYKRKSLTLELPPVCEDKTRDKEEQEINKIVVDVSEMAPHDICSENSNELPFQNGNTPSCIESDKVLCSAKNLLNGDEYSFKIPDLDFHTLYADPNSIIGMELESIPEASLEGLENSNSQTDVKRQQDGSSTCRFCGVEFVDRLALLEHSSEHSESTRLCCTVCDQWFSTKMELDSHFIYSHCGLKEEEILSALRCKICCADFNSVFELQQHVCISSGGAHKCAECNKAFRSEARLEFHRRFHRGERPNYCQPCAKPFPDESKLYKHFVYLHSLKREYCCEECGKVFRSNSSLKYHQKSHGTEQTMKPHRCEHCNKCFIRKSMLRNHFAQMHKDKSREGSVFTCKLCLEAFPSTDHAVTHMDSAHATECIGETTYSFEMHTVNRLYRCEYCDRCFTDTTYLNKHREQHSLSLPFQCKLCNATCLDINALEEHRKTHLSDFTEEFSIPTVYLCEFCERQFTISVKLSEHLTVHFGDEPYQCRSCMVKFKTRAELVDHCKGCTVCEDSYRPYECHYCPKSFSMEDALIKHLRAHTGEKPFVCDQCGKAFSQSSGLYTHQKVHSDERPYSCPNCPRLFKIKGDRDIHVRKHSGARPYPCTVCGKRFMTQHVWSQHVRIHTNERPYVCDVCGVAFRRSHVLTVHKRIHTGEKPNVCEICGKRYRQKGDLLKHRRLQHGAKRMMDRSES